MTSGSTDGVHPLLNVVSAELVNVERGVDRPAETLEPVFVPAVGVRGPMLLAPVEKLIDDHDHEVWCGRLRLHRRWRLGALLHQGVMGLEGSVFGGVEIDLLAKELDLPEPARGAEEWLRRVGPRRLPAWLFHLL
jgi:hypothetical protein